MRIELTRLLFKKDVIVQDIRQIAQLGFGPRLSWVRAMRATVTLSSSIIGPLYASLLVRERQTRCVSIVVGRGVEPRSPEFKALLPHPKLSYYNDERTEERTYLDC